MERKIFTLEEKDGSRREYHGDMQVRRSSTTKNNAVEEDEDGSRQGTDVEINSINIPLPPGNTSRTSQAVGARQEQAAVASRVDNRSKATAEAIPPSPPPSPPPFSVAEPSPPLPTPTGTASVVPSSESPALPPQINSNPSSVPSSSAFFAPSSSSSAKKPPKSKKVNKTVISRSHMYGTYSVAPDGIVLAGSWDEKKSLVIDPSTRNPQKTFKYVVSRMATPVAADDAEKSRLSAGGDDDDEEGGVIKNPNCVGGFFALTADGSGFEHFEDEMMLRTYPDEGGEDDSERQGDASVNVTSSSLKVKAVGWNSGGFFRIQGSAFPSDTEGLMTLALAKEYISEDYFNEEAVVFDRGLAGYDNDDGHIRVFFEGSTYLVPEVFDAVLYLTFLETFFSPLHNFLRTSLWCILQ
jgi:hypothetical protein